MIPSSSLVYFISSLQSACPLPVFKSLYIVLSIVVHPSSGSFVSSASSQRFGITACNVCLSSIHVDLPYCCHSRSIDNCFYSSVRVSRYSDGVVVLHQESLFSEVHHWLNVDFSVVACAHKMFRKATIRSGNHNPSKRERESSSFWLIQQDNRDVNVTNGFISFGTSRLFLQRMRGAFFGRRCY